MEEQAKHTPKPWNYDPGSLRFGIDCWVRNKDGDGIAKMTRQKKKIGGDIEHNGYLIAAGPDLLEACEEALAVMDFGGEMYGLFPGGDPREFRPDEKSCTPNEIENWKLACEAANRGEEASRAPQCATMGDGSAYTGMGFGIGTYRYEDSTVIMLRAAIAKAKGLANATKA